MAFVPASGDCWLKSKLFGDNPQPKVGVVSANLLCQGNLFLVTIVTRLSHLFMWIAWC